jgi:hypothetical protein
MSNIINWHHLFGVGLIDLFKNSDFKVELEKELSIKKQLLDIVIIQQQGDKKPEPLPDGLEELNHYNLITYKSLRESLNAWTIEELIGYYSNYRKVISPKHKLLPVDQFQLYAISTRYPSKLLQKPLHFIQKQAGVFDLQWGHRTIKLIVLSRLAHSPQNGFWHLFGGSTESFSYGDQVYRWQEPIQRSVLNRLNQLYRKEGYDMPYTMEDFLRESTLEGLHLLSAEERVKGLPPEERVKGLLPEERVKGLPPEERVKGLPPEERVKGLSLKERLKDLPPSERAQLIEYVQKLNEEQNDTPKQ